MTGGTRAGDDPEAMPAGVDADILLAAQISADRVSELRHAVTAAVKAAGLTGARLEDFVLAVHELVANVVRHGGGCGKLLLRRCNDSVTCQISDPGPGMDEVVPALPSGNRPGNRGLWLAQHLLAGDLILDSTPQGLTATVSITITPKEVA
ncbi:ATP-binding protein [Micromonospora halotolerans]|uniref:ATP-binding protein n=1 Tax=Micromonospora halotolerans TaxID=709879 RepID=A0ABY9ZVC1_9ACTN|nr:ATP-binding protein [Micromonospora halotolerans]WNM39134.1 ATP-binding protein [Micromonospora halotolerans]